MRTNVLVAVLVAEVAKGTTGLFIMKLTIEIDDELMERVKDITCADTEQQAIELSMMSMSSDAAAKEYFSLAKPHPTYAELRNAYAPDYDPRAPVPSYAGA